MEKNKILLVDDEPTCLVVIEELLSENYEVKCFSSGEQTIREIDDFVPNLIVLDIAMPGMDGYQVCKWLKDNPDYATTPIIFVSAKDMLEERLKGYESGGDDFVTKPVSYKELTKKIDVLIEKVNRVQSLKNDYQSAFSTAMQAMTSAGELGVVMRFLDNIILCQNYDDLLKELFSATESFSLDSTVQIRLNDDEINVSQNGESKPLEAELISRIKDKGRFFDSGTRTFVNFQNISMLVKNMPTEDEALYGRIKDNLPPILNGADARIRAIEAEKALDNKRKTLRLAVEETHSAIEEAKGQLIKLKEDNNLLMEGLIRELDAELLSLDLTEDKELYLHSILEDSRVKLFESHEKGMEIENIFQIVINQLFEAID